MSNKKDLLRLSLGVIWVMAGLTKIIQLVIGVAPNILNRFADGCMIQFYAEAIKIIAIPNYLIIFIVLAIVEAMVGLLILSGGSHAKLGLIGMILLNSAYLPLMPPYTIIVNILFIIPQIYLLLQKDLTKNYLSILKSKI